MGAGGAGGSAGMPPPAVGTLVGSVRMVVEPDFLGSDIPDAAVEIRAPGSSGTDVVGVPRADGSFSLDDVLVDDAVWVAVGAFDDPPSDPFMDTLQVANLSNAQPLSLVVVRRTVMEEIAQVSFLTNPLELDPGRGHAIVSFVDELGVPISGLRLVFPAPEDVGVAYDAGDIYADAQLETSTRGTVVLLNLPAARYPGVVTNVVAELASLPMQQFRANLRVAAGSVTVLTVELDLSP
jgi:hypothetical protein